MREQGDCSQTTLGEILSSPSTAGSPAGDLSSALCFPTWPEMRYSGDSTGERSNYSLNISFRHCGHYAHAHSCVSAQDAEGFREGLTSSASSTLTRLRAQQLVTHATTHTLPRAVIHPARSSCGASSPGGAFFLELGGWAGRTGTQLL